MGNVPKIAFGSIKKIMPKKDPEMTWPQVLPLRTDSTNWGAVSDQQRTHG